MIHKTNINDDVEGSSSSLHAPQTPVTINNKPLPLRPAAVARALNNIALISLHDIAIAYIALIGIEHVLYVIVIYCVF